MHWNEKLDCQYYWHQTMFSFVSFYLSEVLLTLLLLLRLKGGDITGVTSLVIAMVTGDNIIIHCLIDHNHLGLRSNEGHGDAFLYLVNTLSFRRSINCNGVDFNIQIFHYIPNLY